MHPVARVLLNSLPLSFSVHSACQILNLCLPVFGGCHCFAHIYFHIFYTRTGYNRRTRFACQLLTRDSFCAFIIGVYTRLGIGMLLPPVFFLHSFSNFLPLNLPYFINFSSNAPSCGLFMCLPLWPFFTNTLTAALNPSEDLSRPLHVKLACQSPGTAL